MRAIVIDTGINLPLSKTKLYVMASNIKTSGLYIISSLLLLVVVSSDSQCDSCNDSKSDSWIFL